MIPNLTTLLQTVAGKTVLGVAVIGLGVGGAAAAGVADVPVLTDDAREEVEDEARDEERDEESDEEEGDVESVVDDADEADDEAVEADDEADEADDEADDQAEEADGAESEEDVEDPNHGATVSQFAQSTEFEGCEKGQAVAAVARGDVDPNADDFDAEALAALVTEKCADDEADGAESEEDVEDPNHGATVSQFAQSTEFEGCEKGQAVAAVARGDVDPNADDFDPELLAAQVAEKCSHDDVDGDGGEADTGASDAGKDRKDDRGKPAEHPGKGKAKGKNG